MIKENTHSGNSTTMMKTVKLGKPLNLKLGFDDVVAKMRAVLEAEGFTIVSTLDVQSTIKTKFGKDIKPFLALGVYHVDVLNRVVTENRQAALWLPWNISIEQVGDRVQMTLPDPHQMTLFVSEDASWREIAGDLRLRFERIVTLFGDHVEL